MAPSRSCAWPARPPALFALAALFCVPLGHRGRHRCSTTEDDPAAIADRALDAGVRRHGRGPRDRGGARRPTMPISPRASSIWPRARRRACRRRSRQRSTAAVDDANSATATCRELRARADHRRAGRRGRPCRHRARRSVRVRRHPRRGARGQPLRQRRDRPTNWCSGSPCVGIARHRRHLCDASARRRRRASGSRRSRRRARPAGSARPMADWVGRSLREVDRLVGAASAPASSIAEPAVAVRAAREAVKVEKAGGLMQLVGDVGRVQAKAGTQAALDGLKLARRPARDGADRQARREEGQQDPRDPQDAGPRRDPALGRLVQSRRCGSSARS